MQVDGSGNVWLANNWKNIIIPTDPFGDGLVVFLGILLAYGVIGPMATAVEARLASEHAYLTCIRAALLAFARGDAPKQTAEAARRSLEPHVRPSFSELEALMKGAKAQSA